MKNNKNQEKYSERLNLSRKKSSKETCGTGRFINRGHLESPKSSVHVSDIARISRLAHCSWQLMQELFETNRQLSEAVCKCVLCQCALRYNQYRSSRSPRPGGKSKKTFLRKSPMPQSYRTQVVCSLEGGCDSRRYQDVLSQL